MNGSGESEIKTIPPRLYKYRCWTDEHHRRMLTHNAIWFASARNFNDPFDCTIPVDVGQISDSFMEERIRRRIKRDNPSISKREFEKQVRHWVSLELWKDPDNLRHTQEEFQKLKYEQGIFGLSEPRDNLLMWSHYADSHKGFCVGFDTERLEGFFNRLADTDDIVIMTRKVKYQTEYPQLYFYKLSDEEIYSKPLLAKSAIWNYEREYRFVRMEKADVQYSLDKDVIVEVILGCIMPDEHKGEIKEILREKGIKVELYEARMKDRSFGLDFIPVDY